MVVGFKQIVNMKLPKKTNNRKYYIINNEKTYVGLSDAEKERLAKHWEETLGKADEITFKVNWERLKDRIHVESTEDGFRIRVE